MTIPDNETWMINIQNTASDIADHPFGNKIVLHILSNYGADSIENLAPSNYAEVFNELDYVANDLRH